MIILTFFKTNSLRKEKICTSKRTGARFLFQLKYFNLSLKIGKEKPNQTFQRSFNRETSRRSNLLRIMYKIR
jgi:hypothetical protein